MIPRADPIRGYEKLLAPRRCSQEVPAKAPNPGPSGKEVANAPSDAVAAAVVGHRDAAAVVEVRRDGVAVAVGHYIGDEVLVA